MYRIRELHKSNTTGNKFGGNQHIHKEQGSSKLASPNLVARLMGLDGLPIQEVIHRPQKTLAKNNSKQKILPRMSQRDANMSEARTRKESCVEQPQFKDVFEDTMKKSGTSKESTVKFLHQSDLLYPEHLSMQKSPSSYTHNHIAVLKPSNAAKENTKAKVCKGVWVNPIENDIISKQVHADDFVRHTHSSHGSQSPLKSSIISADGKGESDKAKRIVILKPNYVKAQNDFSSFSSPDSSNHELYANASRSEYCIRYVDFLKDVDLSRAKCREVTDTVKRATKEMRDTSSCLTKRTDAGKNFRRAMVENPEDFGNLITNLPYPVRGPDMRGLYDFSENASASKSEGTKLPSYNLSESFVSSEAKRRLLVRLKKAHKYQDDGVNSGGGSILREMYPNVGADGKKITLGEMLFAPDAKVQNLDVTVGSISSKDGWKEGYTKLSSRSRSRSVSPMSGRISEKQNADGACRVDDKLLMPIKATYEHQKKVVNRKCKQKGNSSSKNLKSSKRRSQSARQRYACNNDYLPDSHSSQDQTDTCFNKQDSPSEQLVVPQTPISVASVMDAADIIQHGSTTLSIGSSDELSSELSICMKKHEYFSFGDQEDSTPQRTKADTQSAESSKEADNPSPVSVLQVPVMEADESSPESFEQVSADLRELQKQLQLLKRESKSNAGDSTLNNDWGVQQAPLTAFENKGIHTPAECWEQSYILEVLIESGYYDNDTDMFMATCLSPDCPVGPWLYDKLENTHYSEVTELRHERRLLFDRINAALSDISESLIETCPWVRASTVGTKLKMQKREIKDELHKLLEVQEKEANEDVLEKLLDKDMHWVGSRDSFDAIGVDIEKLVTDELLTELVKDIVFSC